MKIRSRSKVMILADTLHSSASLYQVWVILEAFIQEFSSWDNDLKRTKCKCLLVLPDIFCIYRATSKCFNKSEIIFAPYIMNIVVITLRIILRRLAPTICVVYLESPTKIKSSMVKTRYFTDHLTWREGVMVFCFVQNFFFGQHES
jgi:hypothetical protein